MRPAAERPAWNSTIDFCCVLAKRPRRCNFWGFFEGFDDDRDNGDVWVIQEMLDIVFDRRADLVSAGNEITEAEIAVGHQRAERGSAETSALRHQRHRARAQWLGELAAEGGDSGLDVDDAHAIRAADAHSLVCQRAQPLCARLARAMAAFAETGGQYNRRANAVCKGLLQHIARRIGRCGEHETIDGSRKVGDGRVAFATEHFIIAGIDRKNLALEAGVPQIGNDFRSAPQTLRGPDHGNGVRGQQR